MDCRDVTEYLLAMDNNEPLSPEVARHVESCPRCAREYRVLVAAVSDLTHAADDPVPAADSALTLRVLDAVRAEAIGTDAPDAPRPAPLRNWVIAGTLLLGGLLGLRFSDVMSWLRNSFGPAIDVAMSVILGVFLTGYICILVASNLGRVRRVLRLR